MYDLYLSFVTPKEIRLLFTKTFLHKVYLILLIFSVLFMSQDKNFLVGVCVLKSVLSGIKMEVEFQHVDIVDQNVKTS